MTWSDVGLERSCSWLTLKVANLTSRFDKLEELHLSGNPLLSRSLPNGDTRSESVKVLSLDECETKSWDDVEVVIEQFPR